MLSYPSQNHPTDQDLSAGTPVRDGWGTRRAEKVIRSSVSPELLTRYLGLLREVGERKCRSFDSAEKRFAQDDCLSGEFRVTVNWFRVTIHCRCEVRILTK
jgi:hypothetical protein